MLYIKDNYATVWKAEDKGKYWEVQISTGRKKSKDSTEYLNSSWGFCHMIGEAKNRATKHGGFEKGQRILIKSAGLTREPYEKDGETVWPKNPSITIFDFEFVEKKTGGYIDEPPQVEDATEETQDDIPF